MTNRYIVKEITEVFDEQFAMKISKIVEIEGSLSKQNSQLVMNRIEEYEKRENVEFVSTLYVDLLIFKRK